MKDLFSKDTAKKKTSKAGKDRDEANVNELSNPLRRMAEIDEQLAALQAERKMLDSDVKSLSKDAMIDLYEQKNAFPGSSIKIVAEEMECMFIASDRYITIDEDRANELVEKYDESIVDENTTYSFNTEVLMRNREVINNLIVNSKDISDNDKADLIEVETKYTVAKGTIKNLKNNVFSKFDLKELIEDIRPIFSIKSIKESEA